MFFYVICTFYDVGNHNYAHAELLFYSLLMCFHLLTFIQPKDVCVHSLSHILSVSDRPLLVLLLVVLLLFSFLFLFCLFLIVYLFLFFVLFLLFCVCV